MGVATAVAAALDEGEVVGVLDGLRELLDGLGEQVGVVGDVHLLGDLCLRPLGHVQDARLALDEGPFEALFAAIHVNALAVLAGDIVQEPPDVRGEVAVLKLNVTTLNGVFVAALLRDVIPHGAATETADVFGQSIDHAEAGAHDMRGVMHRDHLLPVTRPAVHVLRMTRGEVLQLA